MDNSEKKEVLKKYLRSQELIKANLEQIIRLRALAEKCTTTLSKGRASGAQQTDRLGDIIASIEELENDLSREIKSIRGEKRNVKKIINTVKRKDLQAILTMRYISGMKWDDIAEKTSYSVRNLARLHVCALIQIKIK